MTRKHFQMIADAIKGTNNGGSSEELRALALTLCVEFKKENNRFNTGRFLEACGL
jgi:hypothetical protein